MTAAFEILQSTPEEDSRRDKKIPKNKNSFSIQYFWFLELDFLFSSLKML